MARRAGLARLLSIFYGSGALLIEKLLAVKILIGAMEHHRIRHSTIEYDIACDICFECSAQRLQGRGMFLASS